MISLWLWSLGAQDPTAELVKLLGSAETDIRDTQQGHQRGALGKIIHEQSREGSPSHPRETPGWGEGYCLAGRLGCCQDALYDYFCIRHL